MIGLVILSVIWGLSLIAFGIAAVWSVFSDPAADGTIDELHPGVGAGDSATHGTASTPTEATAGIHPEANRR